MKYGLERRNEEMDIFQAKRRQLSRTTTIISSITRFTSVSEHRSITRRAILYTESRSIEPFLNTRTFRQFLTADLSLLNKNTARVFPSCCNKVPFYSMVDGLLTIAHLHRRRRRRQQGSFTSLSTNRNSFARWRFLDDQEGSLLHSLRAERHLL